MSDETTLEAGAEPVVETNTETQAPEVADKQEVTTGSADTILTQSGDKSEAKAEEKGIWPEDWRLQMVGGDEKLAKRLSRYSSPVTAMQAGLSAQDKIRSGEMKAPLPEDPTDEQITEWRKANGIPAEAGEYQLPEVKGLEWSDDDKQLAASFFERVHGKNYTQEQASEALSWYADLMAETEEKQFAADTQAKDELEDKLRLEMGLEFRGNMRMLARYAEQLPGVGADILQARLPDGSRLGDNYEFVTDLVERARDKYGDASFVAGDGGSSMANRKAEIERAMREDFAAYKASEMPAEYAKILEAEERRGQL